MSSSMLTSTDGMTTAGTGRMRSSSLVARRPEAQGPRARIAELKRELCVWSRRSTRNVGVTTHNAQPIITRRVSTASTPLRNNGHHDRPQSKSRVSAAAPAPAEPVKTRTLLILSAIAGLAILAAGAIQIWMAS